MGVGPIPVWGKGKLATSYDTTQSSSAFITSWSKHPRAAAQFLTFLHSAQALKAWYKATGVFPADKRGAAGNGEASDCLPHGNGRSDQFDRDIHSFSVGCLANLLDGISRGGIDWNAAKRRDGREFGRVDLDDVDLATAEGSGQLKS
jgi:hypothetical protein